MVEGIAAMKDDRGKFRAYSERSAKPDWLEVLADALTTLAELASIDIKCEPGWRFAEREAKLMAECRAAAEKRFKQSDTSGGAFIPTAEICLHAQFGPNWPEFCRKSGRFGPKHHQKCALDPPPPPNVLQRSWRMATRRASSRCRSWLQLLVLPLMGTTWARPRATRPTRGMQQVGALHTHLPICICPLCHVGLLKGLCKPLHHHKPPSPTPTLTTNPIALCNCPLQFM